MKSLSDRRNFLALAAAATAGVGVSQAFASGDTVSQKANQDGNVRKFGAVGDGKKDDTAAIQAAVDAAPGTVYFPTGSYRVTATITIPLDKTGFTSLRSDGSSQIIMEAEGPAFRFVGTHEKSAAPGTFSADVWTRQRMPMVDNIAILGDHAESEGIEAIGTMQLTISRLNVRNALHGIHLKGNNRNLIISDCHLYGNRGIGIFYDNVNLHQSNITGSHISYNTGGGIVSRGGNVRNIHITGCDIESNMAKDAEATANILIDCTSSAWGTAEVAITGCTVQHNSTSAGSANIRIIGGSRVSSQVKRWGNITISGNILSDVMVNVHLKDCRGIAIANNTFWEGFTHHLLMEDCTNIIVGPNTFDYSPNIERSSTPQNNLRVVRCDDCSFNGLHILHAEHTAGLSVEDSKRINISNCTIVDCRDTGLLLKNVSESIVSGCIIRNEGQAGFTPLKEIGTARNLVVNNLLL